MIDIRDIITKTLCLFFLFLQRYTYSYVAIRLSLGQGDPYFINLENS